MVEKSSAIGGVIKDRFEEVKQGDSAFDAAMAAVKALEDAKKGKVVQDKVRFAG